MAYAGDAAHTAASASDKVAVSRTTPTLTLNNNGKLYNYGTDVAFTAHLGTHVQEPYGGDLGRPVRHRQAEEAAQDRHGQLRGNLVGDPGHDP